MLHNTKGGDMKKFSAFLLLISIQVIALQAACDRIAEQLDIDRPEIVKISPGHLTENISTDATIMVTFSKEMDREKTTQAFLLSAHKTGNVEGYFNWLDGRTLEFSPRIPLMDNCYTVRIETSAEDTKGNDLKDAHESVFYVNVDLTPPEIISHTPADNATGVHPSPRDNPEQYHTSFIRMTFSEPIDVDSLHAGFSLIPAVPGIFTWNATRTEFTYIPMNDLLYGTTYTITLNTSLADIHGNALAENYSYRFTVGDDFTPPEISSVTSEREGTDPVALIEDKETEGCEKDSRIIINFSEPVLREKVIGALRISPTESFYIDAPPVSSRIEIVFHEALESETSYELTISPSISDLGGNIMRREYRCRFITNGINSSRPKPLCITDTLHGFIAPFDEDSYECFARDAIEPVTIYHKDEFMYIIFNKEMKPEHMSLSITRVHGSSGSGLPKTSQIDWPMTSYGAFYVYRFFLSGIDANNVYKLTIRGGDSGIEDAFGNTMEDDYLQYFKVLAGP